MEEYKISDEFWVGKRVLITGHTGFKGSWLTIWLSELGAIVTGISLKPNTNPSLFDQLHLEKRLNRHYIQDICDEDKIKQITEICKPEIIFHLAAQPLVRKSYEDPLGTWRTNVMGSLNVLEALKTLNHHCAVVMVTTDKVYENQEWHYGYRESDPLGGHDPYSASKAATEIAIASWRRSFCGKQAHQKQNLYIATARAGNVIGGGDWAKDRIIPDAVKHLKIGKSIDVRNPEATRPWQHVLEPLGGYMKLAKILYGSEGENTERSKCTSYNFGPWLEANKTVGELVEEVLKYWPGNWKTQMKGRGEEVHEANKLYLDISNAYQNLGWEPKWNFATTVCRTVAWYKKVDEDSRNAEHQCLADIYEYES